VSYISKIRVHPRSSAAIPLLTLNNPRSSVFIRDHYSPSRLASK
jgi:hypothetical protein